MRFLRVLLAAGAVAGFADRALAQAPIEIGFLWHMHQPIYIPGETVNQTDANGHFSFSVTDVHNQRLGPYTTWPRNAIQSGSQLPNLGAQVSFSGSLIENLNNLEASGAGGGQWNNWQAPYRQAANLQTAEGNRRLDLVGFGYHHPLMPLLDERDMRMQIKLHKEIHHQTWGPDVPYSKGIFPAETAFSTRMIPALRAEGIEWTLFDSIHLERAVKNYPHTDASNLYAPNRADQINPALPDEQWVQLNNLWAPSRVAAPFAYRPHNAQHVDPATGQVSQIVAVPAARYEGNEDGRGGFGALQYEQVMSQYQQFNTDPNHPMFVLLHHDGDNFGGGSEAYYHGNFNQMVDWASNNPNYNVSTVQDYLDRFPVDPGDVVHIESGSWAGADNGDPEFKRWLGDPDPVTGWSPDRNSWAVLTAAKNHVYTAHDAQLGGATVFPDMQNVLAGSGSATERGWHYLLQAQASDHWYWDGTEVWDSNVTRGSNLAIDQVASLVNGLATEATAPTVFLPQREAYNPGGVEFGQSTPSDFEVWTYAYDLSGLDSVQLKYRVDIDGENPLGSTQNETYAGGDEVGDWISIDMGSSDVVPPAGILTPRERALRYGAMIEGVSDALVDYYVEAVDAHGNVQRTDIQHVYVGLGSTPSGERVMLSPEGPLAGELVQITYEPIGGPLADADQVFAHVGFDDWSRVLTPDEAMVWDEVRELWSLSLDVPSDASQLDLVFNDALGTWDNNGGADWHYAVEGGTPTEGFTMDGVLDDGAKIFASENGQTLWYARSGDLLYLATDDAGDGHDVFLYLADEPGALRDANWGKQGAIADWDAFVADENDNDFEGWFDAQSAAEAATGADGGVLEAVINLADEFGELPEDLYLALAAFESDDGGSLVWLFGEMTADGSISADEYMRLVILEALPGDYNDDSIVSAADYAAWRDNLSGGDLVDPAGYQLWANNFGKSVQAAEVAVSVPEPTAISLLLCLLCLLSLLSKNRRRLPAPPASIVI